MKYIDFSDLKSQDIGICQVSGYLQPRTSLHAFRYASRPTSALTYVLCDEVLYKTSDQYVLHAKANSIVYIPEGCRYGARFTVDPKVTPIGTMLINLTFMNAGGERLAIGTHPTILIQDREQQLLQLFRETVSVCYEKNVLTTKKMVYTLLQSIQEIRPDAEDNSMENVLTYINQHLTDESMTIPFLSQHFAMSGATFRRKFHKSTGMSPVEYINRQKIARAKLMLNAAELPVKVICHHLNYYDSAYFYKQFKKYTGMTPREYKAKLANQPRRPPQEM